MIHADVEHGAETRVGGAMCAWFDGELQREMSEKLEQPFDVSSADIRSITMYGWEDAEGDAVALVRMSGAADDVIAAWSRDESHAMIRLEGHDVHTWHDFDEDGEGEAYACVMKDGADRLVVMAPQARTMSLALKIVDGAGEAVGDASRLPVDVGRGSILYFGATGACHLDVLEGMERARTLTFDLGEADGRAYTRVSASADEAEQATDIAGVLQGIASLAHLIMPADDPDLRPLRDIVAALRFTTDGAIVKASWEGDPELLIPAEQEGEGEEL